MSSNAKRQYSWVCTEPKQLTSQVVCAQQRLDIIPAFVLAEIAGLPHGRAIADVVAALNRAGRRVVVCHSPRVRQQVV